MIACPGFTESNIRTTARTSTGAQHGDSPLKESELMSATEVARIIYTGIVNRKRTLILTRQGKLTVLLNKLFPAWMDKQIFKHFRKDIGDR